MRQLIVRFVLPVGMIAVAVFGSRSEAFHGEDERPYRLVTLPSLGGPDSRGHSINNLG